MKGFFRLIIAVVLGYFIYFMLYGTPELTRPTMVIIPKGAGVSAIAEKLKDADLIRSKFGFETLVWLKGAGSKLQAGEYKFEDIKSLSDIVRVLTQGLGALNENQLTIIEGWGLQEIGHYLEGKGIAQAEELHELVGFPAVIGKPGKDFSEDFKFLSDKPVNVNYEGYLFPDTYRVLKSDGVEGIARAMLENFDAKLTQKMRDDIKAQGKTIFDITRMASIVEAEVPHEQDRPVIAGILWKRLDAGMALQVDSTLNYVTGGKNAALTKQELANNSPYNTYKHKGLPPGPIGNPGLSALRAAIYPTHTAYWYFMSGKDGKTYFGKTLDEHNANKVKYLK